MPLPRTIAVIGSFVLAMVSTHGCMLNPEIFGTYGARPLADSQFVIEIEPNQLKELGGPSSSGLRAHVDQELAKKGLCKSGYTILDEGTGRGYYYVKGRCR